MLSIAAFLAALGFDALVIAHIIGRGDKKPPAPPRADRDPSAHEIAGERIDGVVDRVRAARGVLVHPCSDGGDLIEYPVHAEFDTDDVLATLAEIEAL